MSVRKRKWITSKGEEREAWVVDYTDMQGDRHVETFAKKKDADARHAEVRVDVRTWRPRRTQQEHHCDGSRQELDRGGRGGGARTLDREAVPRARRSAHRALHRAGETIGAERPGGAQVRGQAARGGAIASDGPQDYREPRLALWPMPRNRGLLHTMPFGIFAGTGGGGRSETPRGVKGASSRSASTSRHPVRSRPSLQMPRADGARS